MVSHSHDDTLALYLCDLIQFTNSFYFNFSVIMSPICLHFLGGKNHLASSFIVFIVYIFSLYLFIFLFTLVHIYILSVYS